MQVEISKPQEKLYDLLYGLWKNGVNFTADIQKYYDYWDGKLVKSVPANDFFGDQNKTSCNVIKQIVETKLTNLLDARFMPQVVPVIYSLSDANSIKNQQLVADTLNCEMHNVLTRNYFDDLQEKIVRWGFIAGFGVAQTTWCDDKDVIGDVKIEVVSPQNIRYDKNAKKIEDTPFIAYKIDINPLIAKKLYAQNPDGTYDENLLKGIDAISGDVSEKKQGSPKNIVNISSAQSTQQAYIYDYDGIQAGKIVKLIVMFLLDDSVYLEEEKDDKDVKDIKKIWRSKYPNGRMIVFSANEKHKLILDDRPSPKSFKDLGNIDFFNLIDFDKLTGKGEVEDLIPIQDRINGAYLKIRHLIASHINQVVLDKGLDVEVTDGDLVAHPVLFLDGIGREEGKVPGILNNQAIEEAVKLLDYIDKLKQEAYETARLNETMMFGTQQTGIESGKQVEELKESPMSGIRTLQRNFKTFVIKVGEKIINFILENYNVSRMIKMTGYKDFAYAKFSQSDNTQGSTIKIDYLDEQGNTKQSIEIDKQWKFKVEVTAGTEIPRSRRENSLLIDKLYAAGVLGDPNDLDLKEQYFRALDLPNYRAFIDIMKQKAAQPPDTSAQAVLSNPALAKAVSDFIKALSGHTRAKAQIFQAMGLDPSPDTLETAPVQEVTSQSDVKEVVTISPKLASDSPEGQTKAQAVAGAEIDVEKGKEVIM